MRTPLLASSVTERDRQNIREELAKIVQTPHFVSSKRYPAFLIYVVEQTLIGNSDELKERTIGVEVFHRKPDFDTNSDTVVRFTAGEVRKRLTTVSHESGPDRTIHIELPVGSYIPEFFQVYRDPITRDDAASDPSAGLPDVPPVSLSGARPSRRYVAAAVLALLFIAFAGTLRWLWWSSHDPLTQFWHPVLSASGPVMLTPGAMAFAPGAISNVVKANKSDPYPYISVSTARALSDMVAMFVEDGTAYTIRPTSEVSLADLRGHPVVLIGAYSNEWTQRLTSDLRYRLTDQPKMEIYDSTNPSIRWARPAQVAYEEADDYAIIARFRDKLTDNFVVVAGGIGKNGTEAAAQFITSSRYLEMLNTPQSRNWSSKNIEFVINIKVVDGKAGSPSIETVYTW